MEKSGSKIDLEFKTKLGEILDINRMKRGMGTRASILVLGLLSKKDMHGYEILKNLDFLAAHLSYSQLYPLLNEMEEKGLVKGKWIKRKKVYSLTKEGKLAAKEAKEVYKIWMKYMEYVYQKAF